MQRDRVKKIRGDGIIWKNAIKGCREEGIEEQKTEERQGRVVQT